MEESTLLLAIDACGPTGSVALGRFSGQSVEILGQVELEGRSFSSTLVAAVGELLAQGGVSLREVGAMVAVNGPGSFTGVRVGLAAVKGLAEAARIPVAVVSRLEVLAAKAGVASAALDAHRHEVFLRLGAAREMAAWGAGGPHRQTDGQARELLAGAEELAAVEPAPLRVALCDQAAAQLLGAAWPAAELICTSAPSAADALRLCAPRVAAGEFVDLALVDGHYLRRSDAEIFGAKIIGLPAAVLPGEP
jgi:tRNA threonylcarbamoyladenosine biosynthesis protein TsaB